MIYKIIQNVLWFMVWFSSSLQDFYNPIGAVGILIY